MQAAFTSRRFEIVRCLGEGAMGVVYEALDRERGVRVALKTLRHTSAEHLSRLKREFRTMQDVQHPSLVALRELVCEDDRWFLTMDLVDGVDFLTHVRAPWFAEAAPLSVSSVRAVGSAPTIPIARAVGGEDALFDEERLREALRQLTDGLLALHAAGMVHRDIKPSNVLVTRDGRVVVLDFGLIAETRADASTVTAVGTPAYMAPEQAVSGDVGPEADWYAVGVLLYEALTGRVPFDGNAVHVMMRKQTETPVPASAVGVGIPPDLDALCTALLRFKPSERPSGGAVLRQLGGAARTTDASASASRTLTPAFVGRAKELDLLAEALADSRSEGIAVVIEGESGLGKSRLVRRFTEQLLLEDPRAVVLAGRCYERESVPYKAFDDVVDALARLLTRLPYARTCELLPTRPAPLVQVFPVLRRVPAIADVVRAPAPALDLLELRSRAFGAMREMLTRLGDRHTLVVVIDDAQWTDHDSLALLAEITRAPDAPRMLLVATLRVATAGGGATLAAREGTVLQVTRAIGNTARRISLGPLSPEESHELAAALAERAGLEKSRQEDVEAIAKEAGGHPLFIDVLARQRSGREGAAPGRSRLDEALGAQVAGLDGDARQIVETVCVAGGRLAQRVVEHAAGMSADLFTRAVQQLRVARLVVTTGARGNDRIEPYHDRVRVAVCAGLTEARRVEVHRAIARALEPESDAEQEALALHWREAGDAAQAARHVILAADHAVQALAFDRAASLYEQAIALGDPPSAERQKLYVKLGDALANAGRGERSARAYEKAVDGAMAADALDLRQRAAVQLLRGGRWDEGVASVRSVLDSVGIWLPRTPLQALILLLFYRLLLRLRSLRFRERDASQVARSELTRIDTCRLAALALVNVEVIPGTALNSRELLLALRCGEPVRVARSLAQEVVGLAVDGGPTWKRTGALLARVEPLAARTADPYAIAMVAVGRAMRYFMAGHFKPALTAHDDAKARFGECTGAYWEADVTTRYALESLFYLGELRELVRRVPRELDEAKERGNVYAWATLSLSAPGLAPLVSDDPSRVRARAKEAMDAWARPGFDLVHYRELYALTSVDLYEGNAEAARARMAERWDALRRSLLLRVQFVRVVMWNCRARAALAVAAQGKDTGALLRAALDDARRMEREEMAWSTPLAKLVRAGAARVRGDRDRAVSLVREAVTGFESADMTLHGTIARRALGTMTGGDEGLALLGATDSWFRDQTVKRPDGFMRMLAPGLARLE